MYAIKSVDQNGKQVPLSLKPEQGALLKTDELTSLLLYIKLVTKLDNAGKPTLIPQIIAEKLVVCEDETGAYLSFENLSLSNLQYLEKLLNAVEKSCQILQSKIVVPEPRDDLVIFHRPLYFETTKNCQEKIKVIRIKYTSLGENTFALALATLATHYQGAVHLSEYQTMSPATAAAAGGPG